MLSLQPSTLQTVLALSLMIFGSLFLLVGLWKVAGYAEIKQMKRFAAHAAHAARIAQRKDLSLDPAALTQAAATLTDSIDRLVRNSSTGSGVFLIIIGLVMYACAAYVTSL